MATSLRDIPFFAPPTSRPISIVHPNDKPTANEENSKCTLRASAPAFQPSFTNSCNSRNDISAAPDQPLASHSPQSVSSVEIQQAGEAERPPIEQPVPPHVNTSQWIRGSEPLQPGLQLQPGGRTHGELPRLRIAPAFYPSANLAQQSYVQNIQVTPHTLQPVLHQHFVPSPFGSGNVSPSASDALSTGVLPRVSEPPTPSLTGPSVSPSVHPQWMFTGNQSGPFSWPSTSGKKTFKPRPSIVYSPLVTTGHNHTPSVSIGSSAFSAIPQVKAATARTSVVRLPDETRTKTEAQSRGEVEEETQGLEESKHEESVASETVPSPPLKAQIRSKWPWRQPGAWRDIVCDAVLTDEQLRTLSPLLPDDCVSSRTPRVQMPASDSWNAYGQSGNKDPAVELLAETKPSEPELEIDSCTKEGEAILVSVPEASTVSVSPTQAVISCELQTKKVPQRLTEVALPEADEDLNRPIALEVLNTSNEVSAETEPASPASCLAVERAPLAISHSGKGTSAPAHVNVFHRGTTDDSFQHQVDTSSIPRSAPPNLSRDRSFASYTRPVHFSHVSLSMPNAGNPFASDALMALGLPSPLERDQKELSAPQESGVSHSRSASSPPDSRTLTKLSWKELGPGFGYELETLVEEPAMPLSERNLTGTSKREEIEDDLRTHASQDADASEQSDLESYDAERHQGSQRMKCSRGSGDQAVGLGESRQGTLCRTPFVGSSDGNTLARDVDERFLGGRPRADTTDTFASSAVLPDRETRGSRSWDFMSNPSDDDAALPPLQEDDTHSWASHSRSRDTAQEHLNLSKPSARSRRYEGRTAEDQIDSSGAAVTTVSSVLRLPSISTSSFGCSAFHEVSEGRGTIDTGFARAEASSPLHSAGHGPIDQIPATAFTFVPPANAPRLPLEWAQSGLSDSQSDAEARAQQGREKRTRPLGTPLSGSPQRDVSSGVGQRRSPQPSPRQLGHRRNTNDLGLPPGNLPSLRPSAPPFLPTWARPVPQPNTLLPPNALLPRPPSLRPAPPIAPAVHPAQMRQWYQIPVPTGRFTFTSLGSKAIPIRKPSEGSAGVTSSRATGAAATGVGSGDRPRLQNASLQDSAPNKRPQVGGQDGRDESGLRLQTALSAQDRQLLIDGLSSKVDRSLANHSVSLEGKLAQQLRDLALQHAAAAKTDGVAESPKRKAGTVDAPSDVYFDYVTDAIEVQMQDLKKDIAGSLNAAVSRFSSLIGRGTVSPAVGDESSLVQKMVEACGKRTHSLLEDMRQSLLDDQVGKISKLMDERLLAALVLVEGERQDLAATVLESLASRLKRWDEIRDHFSEHIQVALINGILPHLEAMTSRPQDDRITSLSGQDADLIAARVTEILLPIISDAREARASSGGVMEPAAIVDAVFERLQPIMGSADRSRTEDDILAPVVNRLDKHAAGQMAALKPVTSLFDPLLSGQEVLLSVANQMVRHQSDFQRQLGEIPAIIGAKLMEAPKSDAQHTAILSELLTSLGMITDRLSTPDEGILQGIRRQGDESRTSMSVMRDALDTIAGTCTALCEQSCRLEDALKDIDGHIKALGTMRASNEHQEAPAKIADTEALVDLERLEEGRAKDTDEEEALQSILARWSDEVSHLREEQARERELSARTQQDLLSRLETAQKDADESRKAVRDYLAAFGASTANAGADARDALDRCARYEGEITSLQKRIADQDAKIGNLQTLTASQKQKAAEAQQKLAEFAKSKVDSENQSQELADARARIAELEQRLGEQEATEERLKSSEAMKEELRGEISKYHEHFMTLEEELVAMKEKLVDRAELIACQRELANSQAEVASLQEQLNEKESKCIALLSVATQTEAAQQSMQEAHDIHRKQHQRRQATSEDTLDRSAGDESNVAEQGSWSMIKSEKSGLSASVWAIPSPPSHQSSGQDHRQSRPRESSGLGDSSFSASVFGSGTTSNLLSKSRSEQVRTFVNGPQSYTMSVRDFMPASSVRSQRTMSESEEVVVVKREDGWWE
ncbi:hypothetical protein BCV69DRAFT_297548 [Microstroma glucosiphilum]|uniref:Uncharacterized protein n=1 Tax=Pseudomicrostroma glucosiphilum TaxID=1684307 RepID=A0A316UBL0_9BASI|nr:hypothetical protein BCV69DRAFT_297548 [Pseudomicrostroma glucosiphilum]PWN22248.1 hypothetical protein BCV69DRAFT_297548 [Pseudomicrostroma glucosiphilum]